MQVFRFDTETKLIRPGLLAPDVICLQSALDEDGDLPSNGPVEIRTRDEISDYMVTILKSDCLLEAFNGAFDWVVLCANFPELTPLIFKALGEGRGRDPMIREVLTEIRDGTLRDRPIRGYFSLAGILKRKLGIEVAKGEETWRKRYALLDGLPVSKWPEDAVSYAVGDITGLRGVSRHQNTIFMPEDEWLQVASAFVLQLSACWGVKADAWRIGWTKMCILTDEAEAKQILKDAGFFSDEECTKVSQKAVKEAVERACLKAGIDIPRTLKGHIAMDADTCASLAKFDSTLTANSRHTTNRNMIQKYLDPLEQGVTFAMTSSPNVVVNTGRTSWRGSKQQDWSPYWPPPPPEEKYDTATVPVGTNLQNWPQKVGIRECVRPRPGYYFCSVDYNSLELRTLGQACLWLVGDSTFARGYQADVDWDPHSYFGGQLIGIDYEESLRRKKVDPAFKNGPRKVGKESNFSLPGGVGAKRLQKMFADLYDSGDLEKEYTLDECYAIKEAWLNAYPEMVKYFELAAWISDTGQPITQLVSNRVRGRLTYSAAANTWFQGLAADLAKRALWAVSQACYCEPSSPLFGCRVVAFIHDEILLEVPIAVGHEAAFEVVRLMVREAEVVCPDVPFAAEPALMTYWTKWADPRFDAAGRLIPWD